MADHYGEIVRKLREADGLLGDIFAQAMPRFNNPVNLKRLLTMIDEEDWSSMDVDVKGAAFEGLLEKAASEGKKGGGTVLHPAPLVQSIVRVMKPDPRVAIDCRIAEPCSNMPAASTVNTPPRPMSGSSILSIPDTGRHRR